MRQRESQLRCSVRPIAPRTPSRLFPHHGRGGGRPTGVRRLGRGPLSAGEEACLVEGLLLAQHVVDGPAQLGRQDRQRLALAALLLLSWPASAWPARCRAGTGTPPRRRPTSDGRCRSSCRRSPASCRPTRGRSAPAGRRTGTCRPSAKRRDVVDLVEQHQGQDLADAGDGLQPVVGLHVVDLGGPRSGSSSSSAMLLVEASIRARSTATLCWTLGSVKRSATSSSARLAA